MDKNRITPEMIEAGKSFLMGFFPAEWGGTRGISNEEAEAVAIGVIQAALRLAAEQRESNSSQT